MRGGRSKIPSLWVKAICHPQPGRADDGGAGGIRTLDTAFQPYNGLANRRLQPLGHSSVFRRATFALDRALSQASGKSVESAKPAGAPQRESQGAWRRKREVAVTLAGRVTPLDRRWQAYCQTLAFGGTSSGRGAAQGRQGCSEFGRRRALLLSGRTKRRSIPRRGG